METKEPSATITDKQRMKLIKWAKKNGAAKIAIGGVEIVFDSKSEERTFQAWNPSFYDDLKDISARIDKGVKAEQRADFRPDLETANSTQKAVAAIRSKLDDPDAFARQTDAWANQTRLPRE